MCEILTRCWDYCFPLKKKHLAKMFHESMVITLYLLCYMCYYTLG